MTKDNIDPASDPLYSSDRPSERLLDETESSRSRKPKASRTTDATNPQKMNQDQEHEQESESEGRKKTLRDSPAAQFEYGRASQHKTERYDRTSKRLERGNPDVGDIDLGNIEEDRPAEPDDNDLFD